MLSFQLMLESLFSKWHNSIKCTNGTYRYKYLLISASSRLTKFFSFIQQDFSTNLCYSGLLFKVAVR